MQRKYKILGFVILSVSAILLGCLREVETPVDPRSTFIPPTAPQYVIVNLQSAILEKNINNYLLCFVDTNFSTKKFTFLAEVSAISQYPILKFWNFTNERYYITALISATPMQSSSNLFLSNTNLIQTSDSAVYDADYLLYFDHTRQNVPKSVRGKLRFIMAPDSRNLWSIHHWADYKLLESDTTWSILKANFLN
ncbi:MAG: hypothetical protein N2490_08280 [Ignavibacteria bacterium]|nr:hypothetical protein [Ignavibacteria bacterium]